MAACKAKSKVNKNKHFNFVNKHNAINKYVHLEYNNHNIRTYQNLYLILHNGRFITFFRKYGILNNYAMTLFGIVILAPLPTKEKRDGQVFGKLSEIHF